MRYYRYLIDYIKGADLEVGRIYPENYYVGGAKVEVYVVNCMHFNKTGNWEEVTKEEYLEQEEM